MAEGRKTSLQAVSQSTEGKKRTVRGFYHYQEREPTKNCAPYDSPAAKRGSTLCRDDCKQHSCEN